MIENKLRSFLFKVLGDSKEYSSGQIYYECPICNRKDGVKKLAICLDEKRKNKNNKSAYMNWQCWRDTSHSGGNLFKLLTMMKADKKLISELETILGKKHLDYNIDSIQKQLFDIKPSTNSKKINLPEEFEPIDTKSDSIYYMRPLSYLLRRGISKKEIIKYNIGFCSKGKYKGRLIIPSYDENGELNYFIARSYEETNKIRYMNPEFSKDIIFNDLYINWNLPIYLVEGIFDAFAIKRNAIPVLGKNLSTSLKIKIIKRRPDVYVILDTDAIDASFKTIEDFLRNGINVYFVSLQNEGGKDPSELGFQKIQELIEKAEIMDFSKFIKYSLRKNDRN